MRRRTEWALPEVRWAALSLVAFLVAIAARALGAPAALVGGMFAVTYAAGGWEPGLSGFARCASGPSTSTS